MAQAIWQNRYSLVVLEARRLRLTFYRIFVLVLVILSLFSLAYFLIIVAPVFERDTWQVILPPYPGSKFFWLTIVLWCYIWYRLAREQAWYPSLPKVTNYQVDKKSGSEVAGLAKNLAIDKYLSENSWRALEQAYKYAHKLYQAEVDPLHLMAGLLRDRYTSQIFARLNVDNAKFIQALKISLAKLNQGHVTDLSDKSKEVFVLATKYALHRNAKQIEPTEILLALSQSDSAVKDVFEEAAIESEAVANITAWFTLRRKILQLRSRQMRYASFRPKYALDRTYTAVETPLLGRVARDLTASAARGVLAPCIARDEEISGVVRLWQGGQNGVVIIGEAGVGKSSILNGLAQSMAADEVPAILQDKKLYSLSIPALLSGTSASEASARLWQVLNEIIRAGNIVLAIENIHQLAGVNTGGELSLTDILANCLSKNDLMMVATTSPNDWSHLLERTTVGQALQKVEAPEPDDNKAIQVLESYVPRLEYKDKVFFSYQSLKALVELSRRYLPDRRLPEKAIALADELSVFVRSKKGKHSTVTAEDVAQVLAAKVHVPLTQVTATESDKLLRLEDILHQRIIGQDEAVGVVAAALRRARVNIRDQKRPVASFLFLGPTGVGKTELAKVVAEQYFGDEHNMVRLDMSEYQTAESVYRLIGVPSGGENEGLLTQAVRKNPYTLVLLDEVEKAHPDILNILLQVLDDGRLTEASGRTVDFTSAIVICTSNAGTDFIQESMQNKVPLEFIRQSLVQGMLKKYFRPELINRYDAVVVFKPLTEIEIEKVAGLMLAKLAGELEKRGIHFRASVEAVKELAHKGFDPLFGARPLRRVIQDNVDNALAKFLLTGKVKRRDVVVLEAGGVVRIEKAEQL